MSVLTDLYFGNIQPSTKEVKPDSEYLRKQIMFCDIAEALHHKLNEQEQRMLDQMTDIFGELINLSCSESFVDGFKLGAEVMVEIYHKNE